MSSLFTSYAFPTADNVTSRTLPDRQADIHNVRDFGALGDGTTDDHDAILAAYNNGQVTLVTTASNQTASFTGVMTGTTLTASSVTGTIAAGNWILGAGVADTFIVSQTSGPTGGAGVYVTVTSQNVSSESMVTVNNTMTFASVPATIIANNCYAANVTNPSAFAVAQTKVQSTTSTTITLYSIPALVGSGETITINKYTRGTIFFPPGTYLVSQPINTADINVAFAFVGVFGASSIVGNFGDYIIKRTSSDSSPAHAIENLTIVNSHATGGGIRLGGCIGAVIRNCNITANQGINTADDLSPPLSSFEVSIENCTLSPGSHVSGSLGIFSVSDGPILCCTMTGFATGAATTGQQGGMNFLGCRFELCGIGLDAGTASLVSGCLFKNCGTAINGVGGSCRFSGIRIEAATGTIAGDPQYGIKLNPASSERTILEGIIVTGQFGQYGIDCGTGETFLQHLTFIGVQSFNTGGTAWRLPPSAASEQFIDCNVAPVYTMAGLPVPPLGITSISWSGGTTTLVVNAAVGNFNGLPITVTVTGMSPSGYNGTFSGAAAPGTFTLTYLQSNPGSSPGTGSGVAFVNASGNARESDCYNISDGTNGLNWGDTAVDTGTHTTHYKVRWNGSNWTVVGK